jgi:purine-binding chemotaxis protein CheW
METKIEEKPPMDGKFKTSSEKKKILHERALLYARKTESFDDFTHATNILAFSLAHERYAFDTSHVREVLFLKALTFLPCAPEFIMGIIHVRGKILSVLDLRKFFHLSSGGITEFNKAIIITCDDKELAVVADEIEGIVSIRASCVLSVPFAVEGVDSAYLSGITKEKIILLNAEKILNSKALETKTT